MNWMNDISYVEWLLELVGIRWSKAESSYAREMNKIPYTCHFDLDENRKRAGLNLRDEFLRTYGCDDEDVPTSPCSAFEVLVALARDFSENADISVEKAYEEMRLNLLPIANPDKDYIWDRVEDWLNGKTDKNGHYTPFPVEHYYDDVRKLDLWAQMNLYIHEHYPLRKDWLE